MHSICRALEKKNPLKKRVVRLTALRFLDKIGLRESKESK